MSIFENETQKRASIVAVFLAVYLGVVSLWGAAQNEDSPSTDEVARSINVFDLD
ncbi:MAG: hypothetical protein H6860_00375 [Rhodospirillales bacterium]|nr:hypothetical protein [Alphaproteobacteria bacterium]MCB9980847.1 hypothetical protein [Rhodospirillales bacterium]